MATSRPFAYNPSRTPIPGTEQVGDLSIAVEQQYYSEGLGGVRWWMGPNEDLGYIICYPFSAGTRPSPDGNISYIGFKRSQSKTEESFVAMSNAFANGQATFSNGLEAYLWLNLNGNWTSYIPVTPTPTPSTGPLVSPTSTPASTSTPTPTETEIPPTPTPSTGPLVSPTSTSASTPTPTPTETQIASTPTNTPTPSVTPSPVTGYSFNLVALPYNFPTSGNSIMNGPSGVASTDPNALATGARGFYFNSIDSDSIDRTNYFSTFTGQSVTITLSQTGSTAIYSGDTNSFKQWIQSPMGSGFVFGAGIGVPPTNTPSGTAVLIQSATTQFTIGLPVYVSLIQNSQLRKTPVSGSAFLF